MCFTVPVQDSLHSADAIHRGEAMSRSPRSATLTATRGWFKRLPRDCQDAWTRKKRNISHWLTLGARFVAPRQRMANMRSEPGHMMRTGRSGTPNTWWMSSPDVNCQSELAQKPGIINGGLP